MATEYTTDYLRTLPLPARTARRRIVSGTRRLSFRWILRLMLLLVLVVPGIHFYLVHQRIVPSFEAYGQFMPGHVPPSQSCTPVPYSVEYVLYFTCYYRDDNVTINFTGEANVISLTSFQFKQARLGDVLAAMPPVTSMSRLGTKLWRWKWGTWAWMYGKSADLTAPVYSMTFVAAPP